MGLTQRHINVLPAHTYKVRWLSTEELMQHRGKKRQPGRNRQTYSAAAAQSESVFSPLGLNSLVFILTLENVSKLKGFLQN